MATPAQNAYSAGLVPHSQETARVSVCGDGASASSTAGLTSCASLQRLIRWLCLPCESHRPSSVCRSASSDVLQRAALLCYTVVHHCHTRQLSLDSETQLQQETASCASLARLLARALLALWVSHAKQRSSSSLARPAQEAWPATLLSCTMATHTSHIVTVGHTQAAAQASCAVLASRLHRHCLLCGLPQAKQRSGSRLARPAQEADAALLHTRVKCLEGRARFSVALPAGASSMQSAASTPKALTSWCSSGWAVLAQLSQCWQHALQSLTLACCSQLIGPS